MLIRIFAPGKRKEAISALQKALALHPWAGLCQTALLILLQEEQEEAERKLSEGRRSGDGEQGDCDSTSSEDGSSDDSGDWNGAIPKKKDV